jgi:hypothetical protein
MSADPHDPGVIEIVVRLHADRTMGPLLATLRTIAAIEGASLKASFEHGRQVYTVLSPDPTIERGARMPLLQTMGAPSTSRVTSLAHARKRRDAGLAVEIFGGTHERA